MKAITSILAPIALAAALFTNSGCSGCVQITGCDLGLGGGAPADSEQAINTTDMQPELEAFVSHFFITKK